MVCIRIKDGYMCRSRIYQYEGWVFEVHSYCGPHPLNKNGELKKRVGRKFWEMWDRFSSEPNKAQHEFN